ncbi:PD40 domain-containing protein [Fodinibius saliphilus]|uniref:PD40 domain-containing protein n=1 Tax=Fodinibius saliphilus TaxID=1920650 RepID=UPI001108F5B0|nr:PD40 domain-containing protein [Fodinibius saliphilus]
MLKYLLSLTFGIILLTNSFPSLAQEKPPEKIIYTTLRPANQDIYLLDNNGEKPSPLTDHLGLDYNPTFSPDGRWLVYTSERNGNTDLYALDLDNGGGPVRLTSNPAMDDAADISSDGERIVFVSTRDGNADIFMMPFTPGDLSSENKAENLTQSPLGEFRPAFSPDGSTIAYSSQLPFEDINVKNPFFKGPIQNNVTHIFLMNADGSNKRRIVGKTPFRLRAGHMISGSPTWSNDGESIYYHKVSMDSMSFGQNWSADIWRINANGSGPEPVVSLDSMALSPVVGPDDRIIFYRGPALPPREQVSYEHGKIYSVNPNGTNIHMEGADSQIKACLNPAVNFEGLIACHGPGPTDALKPKADGNPLLRPSTHGTVKLPDRNVELTGMHGYFPDFLPSDRIVYGESLPQTGYISKHGIPPIVTSHIDGTERQVVLDTDSLGAWATSTCKKDGRIAFNTGPSFAPVDAPVDIWTVDSDGTNFVNLTNDSTSNDAFPAWSSDCEHIIFRSGRDGNKEIYIMEDDGSNPRRLTEHPATDTAPDISPDGEWVVFATGREDLGAEDIDKLVPISRQGRGGGAGFRLYIQSVDGTEGRFLEPDLVGVPGRDMHPRFSPDGKWILFISGRSGIGDEQMLSNAPQAYGELWAIPIEGGDAVRLTNDKWEDGLARWGY